MARLHYVKKAQKDYPEHNIKAGQEYWWIKFKVGRGGILRRFTTRPRPSQLTNSEFLGGVLSAMETFEDNVNAADEFSELESARDECVSELEQIKDDTDSKFNNMPEGLQQGDTGQLLEGRVSSLDDLISSLQDVDIPNLERTDDKDEDDEDSEEEAEESDDSDDDYDSQLQTTKDELLGLSYEGE